VVCRATAKNINLGKHYLEQVLRSAPNVSHHWGAGYSDFDKVTLTPNTVRANVARPCESSAWVGSAKPTIFFDSMARTPIGLIQIRTYNKSGIILAEYRKKL